MPSTRTKVQPCAVCGVEFTARWQFNPYKRFTLTCSQSCAGVMREKAKREKRRAG